MLADRQGYYKRFYMHAPVMVARHIGAVTAPRAVPPRQALCGAAGCTGLLQLLYLPWRRWPVGPRVIHRGARGEDGCAHGARRSVVA